MDENNKDYKSIIENKFLTKEEHLTKGNSEFIEYLRRFFFIRFILSLRNKRYLKSEIINNHEITSSNKFYKDKAAAKLSSGLIYNILSPIIAIIILCFIYSIKGIYPFGENSIIWGDLGQGTVKLYYHMYDVLHGTKSFFYNFNISSGANMYGTSTFMGLLSPISWIIALFKREEIVHAISYLLIIRCALSAFTASIFFKKIFKSMALHINVGLSLMYAFSAYNLTQYTNMMWLDIVIWFPLLVLSAKIMLDKHILRWYIIMLSICLISCFYIGFMVLLFIFFSSITYIYCYLSYCKMKRAFSVFYLIVGTVASLFISAFVIIPSYIQIKDSSRSQSFNYKSIIGVFEGPTQYKLLFFIFTALPVVMLIILIHMYNKHKRFVWFIFLSLFCTVIQAFVESINLMWHTGSYNAFPYRYAFIPIFLMLIACGYILVNENKPIVPKLFNNDKHLYNLLFLTLIIIPVIYAMLLINKHFTDINKSIDSLFMNDFFISRFLLVFLLFAISYRMLLFLQRSKLFPVVFLSVIIVELIAHSIIFIGIPTENVGIEKKDVYFQIEEAVKLENDNDPITRIKDRDRLMSDNYPLVLDRPSISGWMHIISPEEQNSLNKLGYTSLFTRTIDTGGTIFSDTLLGIGRVISRLNMDKAVATLVKDSSVPTENKDFYEDIHIYDYNHKLPFCKVIPNTVKQFNIENSASAIANQNNLYSSITCEKKPLINVANVVKVENNNSIFYVDVESESMLYLDAMGYKKAFNIFVNDEALTLPFLSNRENKFYPQGWQNGLVELGVFKNQTVKVALSEPDINFSKSIYCLNLSDYERYINKIKESNATISYNGRFMNVKAISNKDDECVFLPITYDKGWKCILNGKSAPVYKAAGYFMMVELNKGENNLKFTFMPSYFMPSLLISIGTLLAIAAIYVKNKINPIKYKDYIIFGTYYIYHFIYFIGFLLIYIIPILYLMHHLIKKV